LVTSPSELNVGVKELSQLELPAAFFTFTRGDTDAPEDGTVGSVTPAALLSAAPADRVVMV
jgi:hypothetical protein